MDSFTTFLEQQPLLSLFLVIGLGYALGGANIGGFALGAGAVLFVGLAAGMVLPKAAPPAMLGSLGLLMFVYGVGIMYGKQFFSGFASPFGLKANGLVLLSHLTGIGVCYVVHATFSVAPAAVAGLFCGALTSTPALQAAISAVGNNDPVLGYSVAYPFGFIAPLFCMYFATVRNPSVPSSVFRMQIILRLLSRMIYCCHLYTLSRRDRHNGRALLASGLHEGEDEHDEGKHAF